MDDFMEQLYLLIHEKSKDKQEGSHRLAAEMVAGMIRGSKYWTLDMVRAMRWEIDDQCFSSSWKIYGKN